MMIRMGTATKGLKKLVNLSRGRSGKSTERVTGYGFEVSAMATPPFAMRDHDTPSLLKPVSYSWHNRLSIPHCLIAVVIEGAIIVSDELAFHAGGREAVA